MSQNKTLKNIASALILGGPIVFTGMMLNYTFDSANERSQDLLEEMGYEDIFVFDGTYDDLPRCFPAPAVAFTATDTEGNEVDGAVCASTKTTPRSVTITN